MFLLKRIALAAAMSCLSEGAIAQEGAASGPAAQAGNEVLPQPVVEAVSQVAPVDSAREKRPR